MHSGKAPTITVPGKRKIVLEDFRKMTSDWSPAVNSNLLFRKIYGFFPPYFKFFGTPSAQAENLFPLVLSKELTSVGATAMDGYPVAMMPAYNLNNVVLVANTWHVYGVDGGSGVTDYGIPAGSGLNSVGVEAIYFANKICTTIPINSGVYYKAADNTGVWANVAFGGTNGLPRFMETFLDKLYVVTSSTGLPATDRRVVRIVNSSFVESAGLDLGGNWWIQHIRNVDNRYLAIVASIYAGSSYGGVNQNVLFLWNGLASNSYDYAINFSGRYACDLVKDGVLYVFVNQGPDLVCYALNNLRLTEVSRRRNTSVVSTLGNPRNFASVAGEYFVLATTAGVLYWNVKEDESFYAYDNLASSGAQQVHTVMAQMVTGSGLWNFYFGKASVTPTSNFDLFKFDMSSSTAMANASPVIETNWIRIPEGRGIIERIEVQYINPPPSVNDKITFAISYRDELNGTSTSYTAPDVTSANADTRRALVENLGIDCSKFSLKGTITVATSTWALQINKIIVYYVPINQ